MDQSNVNKILCSTGPLELSGQSGPDLMLDVFPRITADGYEV